MEYITQMHIKDFPATGKGKITLNTVIKAGREDILEEYINSVSPYLSQTSDIPQRWEINKFLADEREAIYEECGIEEDGTPQEEFDHDTYSKTMKYSL